MVNAQTSTAEEFQIEILQYLESNGHTNTWSSSLDQAIYGGWSNRGHNRIIRNITSLEKRGFITKSWNTLDITLAGSKHLANLSTSLSEGNEFKWVFATLKLNSRTKTLGEDWEPFTATNDGTIYFRKLVEV